MKFDFDGLKPEHLRALKRTGFGNLDNARNFAAMFSQHDDWHGIDREQGNLGYGWTHYGLVRTFRPRIVVAIGSQLGFVPFLLAHACRENGSGSVHFVDAGLDEEVDGGEVAWGGVGTWHQRENVQRLIDAMGLAEYIQLHVCRSEEFFRGFDDPIDYAHIDGDHSYEGAAADFRACWERASAGALIALHDVNVTRMGTVHFGVHRLWNELAGAREFFGIRFPGTFGLAFVQKPHEHALLDCD